MLRNIIFSVVFFSGIAFISFIFLPALLLPKIVVLNGGKLMGYWTGLCLKKFMSVNIKILGKENIITNEKFFVAASHQSMFETFYLQTIFNSPVFILKKELMLIPIFGWYLKKIGSISIKRNKITRDNLGFFYDIKNIINKTERTLIIFPQGTRVRSEERPPFKKGAGRIYEELKISCQPVAINSGYVWPKQGSKMANKQITISILPKIKSGMEKNLFVKTLEEKIYTELNNIN
ncbi:1-acyl-sn-glycerol-3-phosphate acyltransferase [Pelagibacterales bacterium SAG-MED43]|nr:1-acyl-sn-glycerol-3-phosphate acyltransferase [Pelagibacterales bacterium SAG-MED43]